MYWTNIGHVIDKSEVDKSHFNPFKCLCYKI